MGGTSWDKRLMRFPPPFSLYFFSGFAGIGVGTRWGRDQSNAHALPPPFFPSFFSRAAQEWVAQLLGAGASRRFRAAGTNFIKIYNVFIFVSRNSWGLMLVAASDLLRRRKIRIRMYILVLIIIIIVKVPKLQL
jgi:hypothetical protein